MKKTVSIMMVCLIILAAIPVSAGASGVVNKSSLNLVRTGKRHSFMINVEYKLADRNRNIGWIIDTLNYEDEYYTEIYTGYTCDILVLDDCGDYVLSDTLFGMANAYFRNNYTIIFSGEITLPQFGNYRIIAHMYDDDDNDLGTMRTGFENYPIGTGSDYIDHGSDPDRYMFFSPYAYSLMNSVNAIREINDIAPLLTRGEGMALADYRLDDFIACHIRSRRGLSEAYDIMDMYPRQYTEFFVEGAATAEEALWILLSNEDGAYALLSDEYSRIAVSCGIRFEGNIACWAIELYR